MQEIVSSSKHQGGELGRFTLMDGVDPFAIEANKDDGKSNGDSDSYDQKDRQDDLIKVVTNGPVAAIGIMIAYHLRPFYMAEKPARVQMQQLCQAEAVKIILPSDGLAEITRAVPPEAVSAARYSEGGMKMVGL